VEFSRPRRVDAGLADALDRLLVGLDDFPAETHSDRTRRHRAGSGWAVAVAVAVAGGVIVAIVAQVLARALGG
jgi:hypothetical protein